MTEHIPQRNCVWCLDRLRWWQYNGHTPSGDRIHLTDCYIQWQNNSCRQRRRLDAKQEWAKRPELNGS